MLKKLGLLTVIGILSIGLASPANADMVYGFNQITANADPNSAQAVAGQMKVTVGGSSSLYTGLSGGSGLAANQVFFTFANDGPIASSISDVYFDDGSIIGISEVPNGSSGVSFDRSANPSNLAGADSYNFNGSASFYNGDSNFGIAINGVDPGEWVRFVFDLQNGKNLSDVFAALALAQTSLTQDLTDGLRIGIIVRAIGNQSETESFLNGAGLDSQYVDNSVPEPSSMALLGIGAIGAAIGAYRRRKMAA